MSLISAGSISLDSTFKGHIKIRYTGTVNPPQHEIVWEFYRQTNAMLRIRFPSFFTLDPG
jgi:hypothetical protein